MKKLLLIILICLLPVSGWGANWFAGSGDTDFNAVSGGTTSSVWNSNADGTSGTYLDWSTQPANGDVFIANGATIAIDDNIGSESVTVTLTTEGTNYGGTDGGGFTMDIGSNPGKTIYANIGNATTPEGTTTIFTITDAADANNGTLTFNGTITGGASTSASGFYCTATDTDARITINGNIKGGPGVNTYGLLATGGGCIISITGNVTGGSVTSALGIWASAGYTTITGNLIATSTTMPLGGYVRWTPTAPSNGVTGHYIKLCQDTSYSTCNTAIYAGSNTDDATKALTTFYYIDPTDGTSDVGTATTGGLGGAWGF